MASSASLSMTVALDRERLADRDLEAALATERREAHRLGGVRDDACARRRVVAPAGRRVQRGVLQAREAAQPQPAGGVGPTYQAGIAAPLRRERSVRARARERALRRSRTRRCRRAPPRRPACRTVHLLFAACTRPLAATCRRVRRCAGEPHAALLVARGFARSCPAPSSATTVGPARCQTHQPAPVAEPHHAVGRAREREGAELRAVGRGRALGMSLRRAQPQDHVVAGRQRCRRDQSRSPKGTFSSGSRSWCRRRRCAYRPSLQEPGLIWPARPPSPPARYSTGMGRSAPCGITRMITIARTSTRPPSATIGAPDSLPDIFVGEAEDQTCPQPARNRTGAAKDEQLDRGVISPRVDRLLGPVDSPYASVIVAAQRARQINSCYHNLGGGRSRSFRPR